VPVAYEITFSGAPDQGGGAETFFLCSVGAWGLFRAWALSLPAPAYAAVRGLADAGRWRGTDALAAQLADALALSPPADPGARETALALQGFAGVGDPDETAAVTG
jgi:hypothetical protein